MHKRWDRIYLPMTQAEMAANAYREMCKHWVRDMYQRYDADERMTMMWISLLEGQAIGLPTSTYRHVDRCLSRINEMMSSGKYFLADIERMIEKGEI